MNRIRITGGEWRSRLITVADAPGLRPTPDRVRETLFNWLGQDLGGWRVVDAFAGTGALGLEAASRGATDVLLIELDDGLLANLRALKQRLGAAAVRVQGGDGVAVAAPSEIGLNTPTDRCVITATFATTGAGTLVCTLKGAALVNGKTVTWTRAADVPGTGTTGAWSCATNAAAKLSPKDCPGV